MGAEYSYETGRYHYPAGKLPGRFPSVKRIASFLSIDRATARIIRKLMDGRLDPTTVERTARWIGSCHHAPTRQEAAHDAIDATLENFGTEALRGSWRNGYWGDIVAIYSNAGDTYGATVCYHRDRGWILSSWGDLVESCERAGERFE